MLLKIDQEFKNLIPPLTHEERALLEKNIIKEGCRDPIVLWNDTIIDGHNRYDICVGRDIKFNSVTVELKDRNEVINWIIDNQLGKRNVPEPVKNYLNGKRKTGLTQPMGGNRGNQYTINSKDLAEVQNELLPKTTTVKDIADKLQISESKLKRSELFADSIDKIAESSGKTAMDILYTTSKITQEDAKVLSTLEPEIQKEIVTKVTNHEIKSFKEALRPIVEIEQKEKLVTIVEENKDTDYCAYTPFTPSKSQITICPCGCGYGYCEMNEKWYNPEDIIELKEE